MLIFSTNIAWYTSKALSLILQTERNQRLKAFGLFSKVTLSKTFRR